MNVSGDLMQNGDPRPALHVVVRGRVQGVGFRDWTRRRARALGCSGWVRNLEDGRSVEVLAEGSEPALQQLLSLLRKGPPGARVAELHSDRPLATGAHADFVVRR